MYRIIYKRVFSTQQQAVKALKEVTDKASNPKVVQGKSGGWLVVLYEHSSMKRIEQGKRYYVSNGLTVYIQEFEL